MNDQEFKEKVTTIAYIYRDIYGVYPKRMYISKYRLQSVQQHSIIFPEPPYHLVNYAELATVTSIEIQHHTTELVPVLYMKLNDVYVEAIEFEHEIILRSAEQLERMAKADVA